MKWSLLALQKHQQETIEINEKLDLKKTLCARDAEILDLSPVAVTGQLQVNKKDVLIHFEADYVVTLPSARSLEPVPVAMRIDVVETYVPEQYKNDPDYADDDTVIVLDQDTIDLDEAVADHILLNIPLQVFTPEEEQGAAMPHGEAWQVISEEDYESAKQAEKENTIDPRLAGLADLFKEDEKPEK